eukprot:s3741_g4.t1
MAQLPILRGAPDSLQLCPAVALASTRPANLAMVEWTGQTSLQRVSKANVSKIVAVLLGMDPADEPASHEDKQIQNRDKDLATSLLAHKGIRVFDSLAWKVLPMSSQGLFKQRLVRALGRQIIAGCVVSPIVQLQQRSDLEVQQIFWLPFGSA